MMTTFVKPLLAGIVYVYIYVYVVIFYIKVSFLPGSSASSCGLCVNVIIRRWKEEIGLGWEGGGPTNGEKSYWGGKSKKKNIFIYTHFL